MVDSWKSCRTNCSWTQLGGWWSPRGAIFKRLAQRAAQMTVSRQHLPEFLQPRHLSYEPQQPRFR